MYIFAVADFEQLNQAWNNFKSKVSQYGDLIKRSQCKFDIDHSLASVEIFEVDQIGNIDVINESVVKNELVLPVYFRRAISD
jgi:hypothetical protein